MRAVLAAPSHSSLPPSPQPSPSSFPATQKPQPPPLRPSPSHPPPSPPEPPSRSQPTSPPAELRSIPARSPSATPAPHTAKTPPSSAPRNSLPTAPRSSTSASHPAHTASRRSSQGTRTIVTIPRSFQHLRGPVPITVNRHQPTALHQRPNHSQNRHLLSALLLKSTHSEGCPLSRGQWRSTTPSTVAHPLLLGSSPVRLCSPTQANLRTAHLWSALRQCGLSYVVTRRRQRRQHSGSERGSNTCILHASQVRSIILLGKGDYTFCRL